jgi:hypothetical protein
MDGLGNISLPAITAGDGLGDAAAVAFPRVIDEICDLDWESVGWRDVNQVAHAYYYFSIQFRENLEAACRLYPHDAKLAELRQGECDTDNLSPWPGVAAPGERLNHDEFMRRLLVACGFEATGQVSVLGGTYIETARALDAAARAISIASYEDGGLTRVFSAMLRAPDWHGELAKGFRHFLEQHIRFDSDDGSGHGSLSRHLRPDDRILPMWLGFKDLLLAAVPALARSPVKFPSMPARSEATSQAAAAIAKA